MSRNFAIIGYPLTHSCSPSIHRQLFKLSGDSSSTYDLLEIPRNEIQSSFEKLKSFDGFNVTIPHKITVSEMVDKLHISAKRYGAVNTVKRDEYGALIGYNTDVDGFLRSIQMLGTDLCGDVLLLGCGGAGRMMAIETAMSKGNLTIAVRPSSKEKAYNLKDSITALDEDASVDVVSIDKIPNRHYDLLINSTPCGMFPNNDDIPIDPAVLENVDNLFDAIYNPRETKLIKAARNAGVNSIGGMTMLVWQAVAAHEIWDGVKYKESDIKKLINTMEKQF